jgi:predicted nucleic acid-binding protein
LAEVWIVNASPLILLGKIERLALLPRLADELRIPAAVLAEVEAGAGQVASATRRWAAPYVVANYPLPRELTSLAMGRGETQVIAHCLGTLHRAVLDDLAARKAAHRLGIPVIGTLGVLRLAQQCGLVTALAPEFERLQAAGLRIQPALIDTILRAVGER